MIFRDESLNKPGEIFSVGEYQPYRVAGTKNPNFDEWSARILDLKDCKRGGIEYFFSELDTLLGEDFAICVVPSHDPSNIQSGIKILASQIAETKEDCVDACNCLVRIKEIPKLAHGGNRSKDVHLESIEVQNEERIVDREVLLLDDVTTTGNSLLACADLLVDAGAKFVQPVALGQTVYLDC